MTGKQNLELILAGRIPVAPPHWERVFQIEKEFFGIDPDPVVSAAYPSQEAKDRALYPVSPGSDLYNRH